LKLRSYAWLGLAGLVACHARGVGSGADQPLTEENPGQWSSPIALPVYTVHAALMPTTGKVLFYSGDAEVGLPLESYVWDPATGSTEKQTLDENLFCSGAAILEDGRVLVLGGATTPGSPIASAHIFDPSTSTWSKTVPMSRARWYPTAVKLADGRVLAVSGRGGEDGIEVYDPTANAWTTVDGVSHSFVEYYPSLHLLPTGEIFNSGTGWTQRLATPTGFIAMTGPASGAWHDLGQQSFPDREEGTAVLHVDTSGDAARAEVMVIGGGLGPNLPPVVADAGADGDDVDAVSPPPVLPTPAGALSNRASVETIDLSDLSAAPTWQRAADLHFGRTNVNAVVLPDGSTLVVGGQTNGKFAFEPGMVLTPELYDPRTGSWRALAPMKTGREYHSVAVLLPDGRVTASGGVNPALGGVAGDQMSMEIFSPPYLFKGPRPKVTLAPAAIVYGAAFDVGVDVPGAIESAALIAPQAVTHHTDGNQRYVRLKILGSDEGVVHLRAPANGNLAPPGFYMLFLVNKDGVPSEARFVRIGKG
jgi:hypothetical protein